MRIDSVAEPPGGSVIFDHPPNRRGASQPPDSHPTYTCGTAAPRRLPMLVIVSETASCPPVSCVRRRL